MPFSAIFSIISLRFNGEIPSILSKYKCPSDVLLSSKAGKCIRFPLENLRVFQSRNSTGVRGIKLDNGNEVISMSILNNSEAESSQDREAYLKISLDDRKVLNELFNRTQNENDLLTNNQTLPIKIDNEITSVLSTEKIAAMAKTHPCRGWEPH